MSAPLVLPNILVCGTPGTGKTMLCRALCEAVGHGALKHFDISAMVKNDPNLQDGYDAESQAYFLNEDAIVDALETHMAGPGGCVVDTHSLIDYFPERWFSLVVCLQTDNTVLFDRLSRRGYSQNKVSENVQCESRWLVCVCVHTHTPLTRPAPRRSHERVCRGSDGGLRRERGAFVAFEHARGYGK
jgi:broad-specificity NMP kinase